MQDLFDDAFTAIERDGASSVEVMIRTQKALASLSSLGHEEMRAAARRHARIALTRAEAGLELPEEVAAVRALAAWASA